ncbi:MAG: NUDIX hydrolase [Rubrivivax sp.]|nr:NUDIX hydrolase [Rubrivivax sp.]
MTNPKLDAHLTEHFIRREERLSGSYLHVVRDTVTLPDSSTATREFIVHPGAVAVIPLMDDGRVVMVRQYRHPVGQVLLELPAGKRDPNEPVLACAMRELQEETGYTAGQWARLGGFHNAAAYSTETMEIWVARELRAGPSRLDEGEFVEVAEVPLEALLEQLQQGQMPDMKTALALLWLARWRASAWPLDWQTITPLD